MEDRREILYRNLIIVNKILTFIVFIIAVFSISFPLIAKLGLMFKPQASSSYLNSNYLIIPNIDFESEILEGETEKTLDKGIWRLPKSSTPDVIGNTVITGHRLSYKNFFNNFLNLDKVKIDDEIIIYWKSQKYIYKVKEVKVVEPSDLSIENDSDERILTLYTCTPLWVSNKRLVVIAELQ